MIDVMINNASSNLAQHSRCLADDSAGVSDQASAGWLVQVLYEQLLNQHQQADEPADQLLRVLHRVLLGEAPATLLQLQQRELRTPACVQL